MLDFAESGDIQLVELPYIDSSMSMVILLPKSGMLESLEGLLDASQITSLLNDLQPQLIKIFMPKFRFDASFSLGDTLSAMGMPDAFDDSLANFSGMDDLGSVMIGGVLHKVTIAVDEQGTEAAAATGVMMTQIVSGFTGSPLVINVDHPFMFFILDRTSGTILFMGKVLAPR